jgi:glycosyltransferase involved in cell wall biosynthesis
MELVTVGLPVYNAERFLKDCVSSILAQTFKDFKLLIVNDGSTDRSMEIVSEFKDPRIEIIDDGENRGLPYRLNQIAKLATTKYLARMDADDIMHYRRLEIQFALMESQDTIDVLGTNTYTLDTDNNIEGLRLAPKEDGEYNLIPTQNFAHPTIIAKTSWFQDNPYDEKAVRCEDAELWLRTKGRYSFCLYDRPLLFYREYYRNNATKYFKSLKGLWYISIKLIRTNRIREGLKYIFKGPMKYFLLGCMFTCYGFLGKEDSIIAKRSKKLSKEMLKNAMLDLSISLGNS